MITFNNITIKNFLSIENISYDFSSKGLFLIKGVNNSLDSNFSTDIEKSNGSGKSAFLDSLLWCLFGKCRNLSNDRITRYGEKTAEVELTFLKDSSLFKIKRTSEPHKIELLKDSVDVSERRLPDTQKKVESILNYTYEQFLLTAYINNGFKVKFIELGDDDKKHYIEQLLNLTIIDGVEFKVKEEYKKFFNKDLELNLKKKELLIRKTEIEKFLATFSTTDLENTLQVFISELNSKDFSFSPISLDDLMLNLGKLKKDLEGKQSKRYSLQADSRAIQSEISRMRESVLNLERTSICPTCKREFEDIKEKQSHITELTAQIRDKNNKINEIDSLCKSMRGEEVPFENLISNLEKRIESVRIENKEKELSLLNEKKTIENNIRFVEDSISNQNKVKETYLNDVDKIDNELKSLEFLIQKNNEYVNNYIKLQTILSSTGFRSFIVAKYINLINSYIEKIGEQLLPYDKIISFNSTTINKSGKESNKISVKFNNNSITYENLSSGERRRIDLLVVISFYLLARDLGKAPNIFILDEVLDTLDRDGEYQIVKFLEELSINLPIFVISHVELPTINHNVLTFVKESDITYLEQ